MAESFDASIGSLFREIGTTLTDVTKQGVTLVGDTVKTSLAQKIMKSPQGQAEIAAFKMSQLVENLPWIALAVVSLFLAGRFLSR